MFLDLNSSHDKELVLLAHFLRGWGLGKSLRFSIFAIAGISTDFSIAHQKENENYTFLFQSAYRVKSSVHKQINMNSFASLLSVSLLLASVFLDLTHTPLLPLLKFKKSFYRFSVQFYIYVRGSTLHNIHCYF